MTHLEGPEPCHYDRDPKIHRLSFGPLFAMWTWQPFDAWFRLFGWGLAVRNHRHIPPLFSERYNGQHGFRRRTYLHVGSWCLHVLHPEAYR